MITDFPPDCVPGRWAPIPAVRHAAMIAALPAAAAVLALAGAPASVGTGIQPGPVCLPSAIHPGASRALPAVTVQDKGSATEAISLYVVRQTPGQPGDLPGRPVPASWATFTYPRKWLVLSQSSVPVGSGATTTVPAHLDIPRSARPGSYVSWIVAAPAGSTPGNANFGASAFTFLEFTVTRPGAPSRHAVCISPGAKQARKAARTARRHPGNQAAGPAPKAGKVTGNQMLVVLGIAVVLGGVALLRRVL